MHRVFRWILIGLVLTVLGLLLAGVALVGTLPRYAPPFVERLIAERLAAFELTSDVRMELDYHWQDGPRLEGRLRVALSDSRWCLRSRFEASYHGWSLSAQLPETAFDQDDPVLRDLLGRVPMPAISNLTFSGTVALDAQARGGYLWSPPVWSARAPIRNVSADFVSDDRPVMLKDLSITPAVTGILSHVDIQPAFLRARALTVGTQTFTNLHAAIHASERTLLLTEAGAGYCGGKVALYSLFLDMKTLNAGFSLFADDIDAGEALRNFRGFHGDASGRLHGKFRLFVKEGGRSVRLHDAFLYSTPGETGKLRLENSDDIARNLAATGLDTATQANVANALTDLDYTALKLSLRRQGEKSALLTTHIGGTATRGKLTVPVNLTLNFHGDIEQLVNLGLDYNTKLKGKKK